MDKNDIVLATDENQRDITVKDVEDWINLKDKENLSNFIYSRLYGRYLRPFDFENKVYKKSYKSGFSIMANCCLLIETFISFTDAGCTNTHGKSERCFGLFFTAASRFKAFSKDGLTYKDYLDFTLSISKLNKGIPKDFYLNVRCGILHSGETRNGWKIRRDGPLCDLATKTINAAEFSKEMESTIIDFSEKLKNEDIDTSPLWKAYIDKLKDIIKNL